MTIGEQVRWWSLGFLGLLAVLWVLSGVLMPFVLGAAIAYFADPIVDRMERIGLPRLLGTAAVILGAIGLTLVGLLLVLPAAVEQVGLAVERAPEVLAQARELLYAKLPELADEKSLVSEVFASLSEQAKGWSAKALAGAWAGGLAVLEFTALLVITPVVGFYMLQDWDRIIAAADDALPRQHREVIRKLAREIDDVLAGFVRGQLTVCLIVGGFYALALSIIGLEFGLLIGLFAGLMSFIPFVGSVIGGIASVGVAAVQFWAAPEWIIATAVVFMIGQVIEGNVLTPLLVGNHVKLHPVWLLFALAAFGTLFGGVGLLIGVPAAAAIGVFARFFMHQYKTGRLYQGSRDWQAAMAGKDQDEDNS